MKEDIKNLWVAALRSGQYKQGVGVLRSNNEEFCCLGVLCDIAERQGSGQWIGCDRHTYSFEGPDGYEDKTTLPIDVRNWAGMKTSYAILSEEVVGGGSLIDLNDGGASFEEIADIIERQWYKL